MKKRVAEHTNIGGNTPNKKSVPQMRDLFGVFDNLDKHKVTDYVIKQVVKHKVPMLTFGKQGEIYKVALPYEGGERYFLVAKKKKDIHDEHYDLRKEFRLQHLVYESVKHPQVKVPELFGYQELPNGEQFIVMEFVPGQTLYTLLLNKITEKNKADLPVAKNDREADTNIVKMFGVDGALNTLGKIEKNPYLHSNILGMKIFTLEQAEQIKKHIKEFLDIMHEKGIYHRDLGGSLRNIMFCSDGKIYIIDFGKAIRKHATKSHQEIYRETTEHGINEYVSDEGIFDIIDAYTEK